MKKYLKSIIAIIVTVAVLGATPGISSVIAKSGINKNNNSIEIEYEEIEDLLLELEGKISELEESGEGLEEIMLVEYSRQAITQLKLDVGELNIHLGVKRSLLVKLDVALEKNNQILELIENNGDEEQIDNVLKTVSNILGAFINELEAQHKKKKLAEVNVGELIKRTQAIIEVVKEKDLKKAVEELELVEEPEIIEEISQDIERMQEIMSELQAMGLTVEFVEENGVYMFVISGSPAIWITVVLPMAKTLLNVIGTILFVEYKLGETLTTACKAGLYASSGALSIAMTALGFQLLLVGVGSKIIPAAVAEIIIGAAFSGILSEIAKITPTCISPLPWTTCDTCPESPEVDISRHKICMGIAEEEDGSQNTSIHGASGVLPSSDEYSIRLRYDLFTWDSYNFSDLGAGKGYWDSFSISISETPYWNLSLTDPITTANLPGLIYLWGGTTYGDGILETINGSETIEKSVDPTKTYYLNVVLDTATLPESNHSYPSWGCIEAVVIPK